MAHLDVHYAAQHGELSTIRSYISASGDLNKRGLHKFTPLHSACEAGQDAAARLLIDAGAAVDSRDVRDNSPLHRAGYYGRVACVKLLLQEGADPTAKVAIFSCVPYNLSQSTIELRTVQLNDMSHSVNTTE